MVESHSGRPVGADFGEEPAAPKGPAPQVCGEFHDKERLDEALSRLEGSAFQRADLTVQYLSQEQAQGPESAEEAPTRHDDVRNLRQLGAGLATAASAMAAAGAVVATGGAALPAVAAAATAGGATLAAAEAIGVSLAPHGDTPMHQAAEDASRGVILMVHAETPEKRAAAEATLRACGATRVWECVRA